MLEIYRRIISGDAHYTLPSDIDRPFKASDGRHYTLAGYLAKNGCKAQAERLRLLHGAKIEYIALGACRGENSDYAEFLRTKARFGVNKMAAVAAFTGFIGYAEFLRRDHGADVNAMAFAAARGHHKDYAETLRYQHSADITEIARGAALGGYVGYAEELRVHHKVNVDIIAAAAAEGARHAYLYRLIQDHGASPRHVKALRLESLHYSVFNLKIALLFFNRLDTGQLISKKLKAPVIQRTNDMLKMIHYYGYTQDQAFYATAGVEHLGFLYLLLLAPDIETKVGKQYLPLELWAKILSFAAPVSLSETEIFALRSKQLNRLRPSDLQLGLATVFRQAASKVAVVQKTASLMGLEA